MKILDFDTTDRLYESDDSLVFRAKAMDGTPDVILKILKGDHPPPQRLARFRREFDIASRLQSPRVLKVIRQEPFADTLVSVVEDFGADSLGTTIREGHLELRERLLIAVALCDGLADIHAQGIIHADLGPGNILWNSASGTLKITDFGMALPIEQTSHVAFIPKVLEGSLSYMSPEQTGRMNRPVDYRSDFYSLGVTLYELFTGAKPFASEDPLEMIHGHIAKRPVPPAQCPSATPEALSNIVLKLLEKNAEDRYQSTDGIRADLVECLRQLDAHGTITPFPVAGHDVNSRFQLSPKLYGRERDVAVLSAAFERVLSGEMAFTLVGGWSGVGKSSLVQELYRPLAIARGRYVTGKYDQYQRSVPYSAISQALDAFCDQLLCEPPALLQAWRGRIAELAGRNGAALIEVIPRLENLLGPQPPLPERDAQAAQNILTQLFQDFVQAICRPEEPLVLFLDDLQWADRASLALLKTLLTNPRVRGLHLVGAYRDNEVASSHPLILMLDEIAKAGRSFATIHLDNLSQENVAALIAASLLSAPAEAAELAQIVYSKTQGNAFFTIEFLKALYADGLLTFSFEKRQWHWDAAAIHARQITDNVVALMAGRIQQLPASAQDLLRLAACIGNRFDLRTLAVLSQSVANPTQVLMFLAPALRLGVVVPLQDVCAPGDEAEKDVAQRTFKFQHDRVQQAAYSLIPEDERPTVHLYIARHLLGNADQTGDLDGSLFAIASHFKQALTQIVDRDERLRAATLNLQAGLKARRAAAYHASWDHFRGARELLPADAFAAEYDLAFQIHLGLAKSSSVVGKSAESEALYSLLLQMARTTLDKSAVHLLQMDDYHLQGAYEKAIDVQKSTLLLLGEQVPASALEFAEAVDTEVQLTAHYRGPRSLADLIAAPEIAAPEMIATLKTLMSMWISAYLVADERVVQWCSVRLANLTLQHGNSEMSALAFVQYGYLCVARLGKFEEAQEYGDLALKLANGCDNLEMRGKIYFMYCMSISHWKRHVSYGTELLRKAYSLSVEGGDWTYAVYAAIHIVSNSIIAGISCAVAYAEAQKYLEFLKDKAPIGLNSFFVPAGLCALLNLQGKTVAHDSLSCQYLDENEFEANATNSLPTIEAWFCATKLRSLYLYRSFAAARQVILKAECIATTLPAQIPVTEANFYSCLMMAATDLLTNEADDVKHFRALFERYEKQLKVWADHCPENHLQKYCLVKGERARVEGKSLDEVLSWYDRAIGAAQAANFPNIVALACELKARFWLEKNERAYALADLKKAHAGYQSWGAMGKVAMLEEEFGELSIRGVEVTPLTTARLDVQSVHKAATAISGKIEVRDLIRTMMTIVLESAGADRGVLLLEKNGDWQIEACADVGPAGTEIAWPGDSSGQSCAAADVPSAVIHYVVRTQAAVTVSEPVHDPRFGQDAYVLKAVPRSILCVPVIHQGRLTALIYLENKLGPNVFSADRCDVIDVLASQIAVSLENATLYADLKDTMAKRSQMNAELELRVQERTADLRRSNEELEQFAYVASHDLQEPLRKVSSFAELLGAQYKGKLDADADEFIGYMVDGARRMQGLIQHLLAYSRLGRKDQPLASVDSAAVLKQALVNLQGAIEESDALVTSDPLPTVSGDEIQLVQLFQNLIANGIKFRGANKPLIHVRAESNGADWTFSVHDNGIGIDPQFAERIFVIFQRLHTRDQYAGTGIGLAFCKKIIERHGGRIWMESEPGRGTSFCFTLPRSENSDRHQENVNEP
jgi:predicted ATPase/signal transduction histidine kinase